VLAFAGLNKQEARVIVAFRSNFPSYNSGTQNIQNFISDLKFIKSDYPCPDCKVHTGFYESYLEIHS